MADPLVLKFDVETSRAKQGIADLAGSITNNMATVAAAMTGGAANTNKMGGALENLIGNARRAGLAVGTDILKIANDTSAAATRVDANLQGVATAFTKAAVSSNTATEAMRAGFSAGTTALSTLLQQVPALGTAVEFFIAYKAVILGTAVAFAAFEKAASVAAEQVKKLQEIAHGSEAAGVSSDFFQVMVRDFEKLGLSAKAAEQAVIKARSALTDKVDDRGQLITNPILAQLDELANNESHRIARSAYNLFKEALPDDIETKFRATALAIKELNEEFKRTGDIRLQTIGNQFAENLGLDPAKAKEFADRIREGKTNVDELKASAQSVGSIFDSELVRRSDELDKKIAEVHHKLEDDMRPIMKDLASLALDFKEAWSGSLGYIDQALGAIGRAYENMKQAVQISPEFRRSLLGGLETGMPSGAEFDAAGVRSDRGGVTDISARAAALGLPDFGTGGSSRIPTPANVPLPPSRPPPSAFREGTQHEPKKEAEPTDEVETYIKSLQKAVDVLEAENRTYGLGNIAKAEAVDLEKALAAARTRGSDLTDKERARVKELADEEGRAKDKAEQLQKATEGANARANFLGEQALSVFERIGQSGVKARDVILDLAKAFEKAALQAVFLGSGPFANLFGTQGSQGNAGGLFGGLFGGSGIFRSFGLGGGGYGASDYTAAAAAASPGVYGPGFAEGGLVRGGGGPNFIPAAALARARHFDMGGGVPAILHPGEIVLNQAQQKNVASGLSSGPKININHAPTINGTGLSADQLAVVLDKNNKSLARNIGGLMSDWQRRHG